MKHSLTVTLKTQSVAIERMLRVVRHRGFDLSHMQLGLTQEQYQIEMTVSSDKPIYLLTTQLSKLIEVKNVAVHDQQHAAVAV